MRISDWSSDVCSSDLRHGAVLVDRRRHGADHILRPGRRRGIDILPERLSRHRQAVALQQSTQFAQDRRQTEIGRAAGRERVWRYVKIWVAAGPLKQKTKHKTER